MNDSIQASYYYKVVKTLFNSDVNRVVVIFQRPDDTYGFDESGFRDEEQCWFPCGQYSESFIDSLETALKEVRGRVAWLSNNKV